MATASLSIDRLIDPSIEVLDYEGSLYSDGWISAKFGFEFRARRDIDSIVLRFWNPDFAARYLRNRLTVSVNDVSRTSPPLFPEQMVHFEHDIGLAAGKTCKIRIVSEQYCESDELDERERGIIFVDAKYMAAEASHVDDARDISPPTSAPLESRQSVSSRRS